MKLSSFGNVHAAGAIVAALVFMACADSASNTSGTNAPGTDGTSTADSVAATDVAGIADVAVTPDTGGTDSAVLQDIAALPDIANFGGSSDLEAAPDSAPPTDVVAPEDTAATDTTAALDTTATADTATDAAAPPADVSSTTTWFPSWKDEQGCEHWQYFDATTKTCISDNPSREAAEADCWHFGQVNAFGIGKPCKPGEVSCAGQTANCCLVDAHKYGAVCTSACTTNADCGEGAWCHTYKKNCLPAICETLFTVWYPSHLKQGYGFACGATANAWGIGAPCKSGGEACKFWQGNYCLGDNAEIMPPKLDATSFCTRPCASDADCGDDAVCIFENGKEYFCSPKSCADQFKGIVFNSSVGMEAKDTPYCE